MIVSDEMRSKAGTALDGVRSTHVAASEGLARAKRGIAAAFGAYLAWGLFPVYFRALRSVAPLGILAHRIVWSVAFLLMVLAYKGRLKSVREALLGPGILAYVVSTALISSNWLIFIWAVNTGHVLDTSLGYFINPLINVLLGVGFMGERLRKPQAAAVALAASGVVALAIHEGGVPWISLALASTFALYGFTRKRANIEPIAGLFIETTILAPFAACYLALHMSCAGGVFGPSAPIAAMLVSSGVVTATPLIWFCGRRPHASPFHNGSHPVRESNDPVSSRGLCVSGTVLHRPRNRVCFHLGWTRFVHLGRSSGRRPRTTWTLDAVKVSCGA